MRFLIELAKEIPEALIVGVPAIVGTVYFVVMAVQAIAHSVPGF